MSMMNINLGGLKELSNVPVGRYSLVIASAEQGESKEKKNPQFELSINIEGHDEAYPVRHWLSLPSAKDDQKTAQFKALMLKRFLTLFKVPHTDEGFNPDDLVGARAEAELQLSEPKDGKPDSVYNVLVVPKLPTDAGSPSAQVASRKR